MKHWFLLLASFRFGETQYLRFTTRVFGHSAITPFLGGYVPVLFLYVIFRKVAQSHKIVSSGAES